MNNRSVIDYFVQRLKAIMSATSYCVGQLICPEGHVSLLKQMQSNPIKIVDFLCLKGAVTIRSL